MLDAIRIILKYAVDDPITKFFSFFIVVIFLISIYSAIQQNRLARQWASLLPTVGIAGTFVGVFLGLQGIDDSFSPFTLINSMKIAFSTSILGLILYIISSVFIKFKEKQNLSESPSFLLYKILESTKSGNDKLDKFLANVTKSSTDAIVKALQKVIKDFNTKINEQFGENFKHLNEGVKKLVLWQQEYKEHMDSIQNVLKNVESSLKSSSESTELIKKSFEDLDNHIKPINEIVRDLQKEHKTLIGSLQSFSDLSEKAKESIPNMEEYRRKSIESIESIAEKAEEMSSSTVELFSQKSEEMIKETGTLLEKLSEGQKKTIEKFFKEIDKGLKEKIEKVLDSIGEFHLRLKEEYYPPEKGSEQ